MAIDHRLPWKEAGGSFQYGLNTPVGDGVNMAVLMVQDTLRQNNGHSATTVDGRNAFNSASRQKILDLVYATFPQLATFVETWYLVPSPLWFCMIDHTIGSILSRAEVQQGCVIATFLFTLIYGPVLHNIFTRMHAICNSIQLFAILDNITFTAPTNLASRMFAICTEELAAINISTVPNKTHMLINISDRCNLPSDLHSEIQVHTDGITLLGTAIGDDKFLQTFLDQKLHKVQVLQVTKYFQRSPNSNP